MTAPEEVSGQGPSVTGPPEELAPELAKRIRLVILDVDGVLTDGAVYLGALPGGETLELKRFDIQDGIGIRMLQRAGVEVAVVSGRISRATEIRARELEILECHQDGAAFKIPAIVDILRRKGLGWEEVAMLGDDLPDMAVLRRVGLPAVVGNATEEVRGVALWRARKCGGNGAVREFCEALLKARGEWDTQVDAYVGARMGEGRGG